MADKQLPSPELLRQLLDYDPESGNLYWLARPVGMFQNGNVERICASWNSRFAGKQAMTACSTKGYLAGQVLGVFTYAHRVIWAIIHGVHPTEQIDHINGIRTDNRLANLRAASRIDNARNRKVRRESATQICGVSHARGKWKAIIKIDGKSVSLGLYGTSEEAIAARKTAEEKRGYHPNNGTRR